MQAIFLDIEILICSTEWGTLVFHKTSMCRSVPASFWCVLPVITSSRRERDWFWLSHSSATRQGVSPSNSGTGSPGPAQSAQVKFGTFRAIFAKVQLQPATCWETLRRSNTKWACLGPGCKCWLGFKICKGFWGFEQTGLERSVLSDRGLFD